MKKRKYGFEFAEVVISIAIIVLTIVLFFRATSLSVLFPIVFGLAFVLTAIYGVEGYLFNRNRVVKTGRIVLFLILSLVFLVLMVVSILTILG